jgi:cytochrome c1
MPNQEGKPCELPEWFLAFSDAEVKKLMKEAGRIATMTEGNELAEPIPDLEAVADQYEYAKEYAKEKRLRQLIAFLDWQKNPPRRQAHCDDEPM